MSYPSPSGEGECSRQQAFGVRSCSWLKFLNDFNAKNFRGNLSPALRAALSYARLDPRGAFLEASWNGIGTGARCRASQAWHRDGTGSRLRLLRTGARSSLTERLCALHVLTKSAAPNRKIAELERCEARFPQGKQNGRPMRRAALRSPRFFEARAVMEECPGRAKKSAGAGTMALVRCLSTVIPGRERSSRARNPEAHPRVSGFRTAASRLPE